MLKKKLLNLFVTLKEQKHRALVHCAAGVHRTGVVIYFIQRMFKFEPDQAYSNLQEVRQETYKGVGDWRIQYAEELWNELKSGIFFCLLTSMSTCSFERHCQ